MQGEKRGFGFMWKYDGENDSFAEVINCGKRKERHDEDREMEAFVFETIDENKAAYKGYIAR